MANGIEKSRQDIYQHPWYTHIDNLNRPNPPTSEAIEKAKFIDKTYEWNRDNSVRPRDKRTAR